MCLPCLDSVLDALRDSNPFTRKRGGKISAKGDSIDRDNINVPYMCEEKLMVIVSDPDLKRKDSLRVQEEKVMTMKKVSSLALV